MSGDRTVIMGGAIHAADGILADHALVIAGGRIRDIVAVGDAPRGLPTLDIAGGTLAAGFIDLQVNGGGGVLFNDAPSVETITAIGAAHRRFGTTGFLPTFITGPAPEMARAIEAVRAALAAGVPGVLGIHLEGPHISPDRAGVHDPRHVRPLERDDDRALLASLGTGRTLVTLAPECADDTSIAVLAARGIRIALGHTDADRETLARAIAAGATSVTHLFNAMRPLGSREPGGVGAALADDAVWCGLIADGHHVHWDSARIAWRAKAPGKLFLVTDAMPPAAAKPERPPAAAKPERPPAAAKPEGPPAAATPEGPPSAAGAGMVGFRLGGGAVRVENGRLLDGQGRLAGSMLTMDAAVRNCVRHVGVPLDEALRMAAAYPADCLGVDDALGRIAPGLRASLVWLDASLRVRATWIDGVRADHAPRADGGDA